MREKTESKFIMCFLLGAHLVQTSLGHPLLNQLHAVAASLLFFGLLFFDIPAGALAIIGVISLFSFLFSGLLLYGTFMLVVIATLSMAASPESRPILRFGLFTAYFLSTFSKLNYDFFNPLVTCATHVFQLYPVFDSFRSGSFFASVMPWIAVLIEGFMAFGLLSKRLAPYSLITAMLFHTFMLGGPVYAMAFNLLALAAAFMDLPDERTLRRVQIAFTILLSPFAIRKLAWAFQIESLDAFFTHQVLQISAALIFLGFAYVIYQNRGRCEPLVFGGLFKTFKGKIVFAFLFLWGAQPYLGLNTMQSFTMHSNLRTETSPNHLLLRHFPQFFSLQRDLVSFEEYSQLMSDCDDKILFNELPLKSIAQSGVIPYGRFSFIPRIEAEYLHLICKRQDPGWRKYFQFRAVDEPSQCRN